jgi:hypothetical protein
MKFKLIFISSVFFVPIIYTKTIEKDVLISFRQEIINGKVFKHRIDIDGLKKKESYVIDDKPVSQDAYLEELAEAEKQEIKNQRQQEHDDKIRRLMSKQKMQIKINLEELSSQLALLQKELRPLLDDRLEEYIKFSDDTIESVQAFKDIINEFIPEIKKVINQPLDQQELNQLSKLKVQITQKIQAIKKLLTQTIEQVIEQADDTQLLKELLVLISDN